MATKRKANDAFGKPGTKAQLSAFAAARLAKQPRSTPVIEEQLQVLEGAELIATAVGTVSYDGQINGNRIPHGPTGVRDMSSTSSIQFSSFDRSNVSRDDNTEFRTTLKPGQSITVVGEYDLQVLKGSVTAYGATLRPQGTIPGTNQSVPGSGKHRVFAPSITALPQIVARHEGALISISAVESTLNKLGTLSPLFRNISSGNSDRSFTILHTNRDDPLVRSLNLLESDKEISTLVTTLSNRSEARDRQCTVVVGAKSAGKSTFNRMLCNSIITMNPDTRCLYLDIDPGQPEFGPPGQVSLVEVKAPLLGPPYSHPATTNSPYFRSLRAHTIASTSFKDDTGHYLHCVKDLIKHISHRKLENFPLVVNSCGWVNGIGASVITDMVSLLHSRSLDLVVLEPVDSALVQALQSGTHSIQIHKLPRRPTRPSIRTPAELRNMQSMAYFHHAETAIDRSGPTWVDSSIDEMWPYSIAYDGANPDILVILSYGYPPDPGYLAETLDGSIVAIVKVNDRVFERESSQPESQAPSDGRTAVDHIVKTAEGLPYLPTEWCTPLEPTYTECLGLALVRGIDVDHKRLLLISPTPQERMVTNENEHIVLVRGAFDPPEWAYLESLHLHDEPGHEVDVDDRPWVNRRDMVGVEGAVWRMRHPPMASAMAKQL
nr:polynucleotide 5'-hydroxyl-kinase grc3 [Quercus suber]